MFPCNKYLSVRLKCWQLTANCSHTHKIHQLFFFFFLIVCFFVFLELNHRFLSRNKSFVSGPQLLVVLAA